MKRLRRFSAEELLDDACPYSSDGVDAKQADREFSFREYNRERNRIHEMDMRDFRGLREVDLPAWRAALGTETRTDRIKVVYFIQALDGGPIKVGSSTLGAVRQRLTELQVGNPLDLRIRRLVAGDWRIERALHSYFREHRSRLRGEWFHPVPELEEIATPSWERARTNAGESRTSDQD